MKVIHLVGARPNFIKVASAIRSLRRCGNGDQKLVHSGQHYDHEMSAIFFQELDLPTPDLFLGVGSGSHAYQIAEVMKRLDRVLSDESPDCLLVYGDVNSTVAGALAAAKRNVPIGHVEAGLRSFDRKMPEEVNRVVVDHLSQWLFAPSRDAVENLKREGIADRSIHIVGNVMIDTLLYHRQAFEERPILDQLNLRGKHYLLVTLHRPSNVDRGQRLEKIFRTLEAISRRISVVFPLHPRTAKALEKYSVEAVTGAIRLLPAQGYLDFLCLLNRASMVVTDSGGVQEESTFLGVPCLTLRETTERPVTIHCGTNRLVGSDPDNLLPMVEEIIGSQERAEGKPVPALWDGYAGDRIAAILSGCSTLPVNSATSR